MRQKCILLRLVEAMYFVAEEDGALTGVCKALLRESDDLANACNAFRHCTEMLEHRLRALGNDAGERCLASARGSPEDDAADVITFDQLAQRLARTEQMLL